jgi:O-antigen ligase
MSTAKALKTSPYAAPYYAYLSLAPIGLMCIYAFLNYYHEYPWTTFYQEWGTAVFGLAGTVLLLGASYWRQSEIPRIVLLPIGMLLLVVVQYALGKMPYFGQMLLFALYLMWATLLIMLGARLRETLGLPAVATALAVCLLFGAELGALIGMQQHYRWHSFLEPVVALKASAAIFGNVAQQNHYADYETLGLVSLGLLYGRGALRGWQAALLAAPILFVLPLTGTRATWAYLIWLCVATLLWQWRDRTQRPLLHFCLAALVGFALMHLTLKLPWLAADTGSVTSVERMFAADVQSGVIRVLHLWPEAARIFLQFPLLGAGFGEYGWEHFQMSAAEGVSGLPGLYNNAHNLVMDVAAEGGLAGLAVLFGTLALWVAQARRQECTPYHWWGYALLSVLGIHSMLEYPLWYAYFLGIAAILLGLLDASRFRLELGVAGRVFMALALLLGALSLQQLYTGYRTVEDLSSLSIEAGGEAGYYAKMKEGIAQLHGQLLLQPYADFLTGSMIEIDPRDIDYKLELNGRVERYVPVAAAVYRQSMLLAQNGNMEAAQAELERAIWAYPGDYPMADGLLRRLAVRDPIHFNALLEFAIRKHEEYRSAVYPK